ncbi:MAG: methyltransferase [Clostridia bacterium]|nr:methyltransferase [Clostridia bacterium]
MDILSDETIDDLMLGGLKLIQKKKGFKFGVDAVLLADFASCKRGDKVCELGSGSGIVSILCAHHYNARVDALEIMPEYADMASRSVEGNNLEDRVKIYCCDMKNATSVLSPCQYDCVVTNPPYKKLDAGENCAQYDRACSRSELCATLDDVVKAASLLIKNGGKLVMVHRPQRLTDIILTLEKYKFYIKKLRFVASKKGDTPVLLLLEAKQYVKSDMLVLPELILYNDDGSETEETKRIYRRTQI